MSFILRITSLSEVPFDFLSATMGEIDQITQTVFQGQVITPALKVQVLQQLHEQFPAYLFRFEEPADPPLDGHPSARLCACGEIGLLP